MYDPKRIKSGPLSAIQEFQRSVITNTFVHRKRDQSEDVILRTELKTELKAQQKALSLSEQWALTKQKLTAQFAHEGNKQFLNECRKVEKSRKKSFTKTLKRKAKSC